MNAAAIERTLPKTDVRMLRTLTRAHLRYYRTVGVVVGDAGPSWRVIVYGPASPSEFVGFAVVRVPAVVDSAWDSHCYGREWSPDRLKKRRKQHRAKARRVS